MFVCLFGCVVVIPMEMVSGVGGFRVLFCCVAWRSLSAIVVASFGFLQSA